MTTATTNVRDRKNRFTQLLADLRQTSKGAMTLEGGSMRPILEPGALLTYEARREYEVGDIVFWPGTFTSAHGAGIA